MVPQYISINDPVERADPGHRGDDVGDDRWSLSAAVASRAKRKRRSRGVASSWRVRLCIDQPLDEQICGTALEGGEWPASSRTFGLPPSTA
jgi:hypothetical protein